ncbi:tRNA (cytidine(34)-2'-O)-methyltransferase [Slackia heliotrinireducens]|uniref:tRNA (cytidine(34)-2'-O)-methyltransferase n=1 Tax=Slackia heliotrinireducens TaxID=84110 RepID=UPI003315ADF6
MSDKPHIHVVLFEPEIPQNTGNVARTCAVVGATLHLVEPMGFRLTERNLKRSGCDYWDDVDVVKHASVEAFLSQHGNDELHLFTSHTETCYTDVHYGESGGDVYLVFGRESRGIDEDVLAAHVDRCVRIPMRHDMRSLNLSNTVAVGVYEVVRQWGGLE